MVPSAPFQTHANGFFIRSTTFSSTRKVGHQLTTAAAATTIVLVVARAIFSGTQAPVRYAAARGDPDASPTPDKAQA